MHPLEKAIRQESVDKVLQRLKPYKPKKLILGKHFTNDIMFNPVNGKVEYFGIPVALSDNKYELDFEL